MNESVRSVVRRARNAALAGLRLAGGIDALAASEWRRRRLVILCYHGVSLEDEHEWNERLFVTLAFLRRRFEILRDGGYKVLTLESAVRDLGRGTLPHRSVVLTFDDGYHDFHSYAVPLLEEFGYPATNYVSTYYCVHQRPIPTITLRYLLWRARGMVLEAGFLEGQDKAVDLGDVLQRDLLAAALLCSERVLAGGAEAQDALLEEVASRLRVDLGFATRNRLFHLMTPEEVSDVAGRGFDIQLHTHRHQVPRGKTEFFSEITENRRVLEDATGRPAKHFCYPSGDVDQRFLAWLRELGIATATTTVVPGMARDDDDPLLLPRYVDTMAVSETLFRSWLSGASAILKHRDS